MTLRFDESKAPFIDLGKDIRIAVDFTEFSDKTSVEKARNELRETPEIVESSLKELRELLKNDKDLIVPIDDDAFLIKCLRPRKYYASSAYELIKAVFKMKAKKDFIVDHLSASDVRVALEERVVQIFPKRDQHGRRIIYLEMGASWNCSKVPFMELTRASHVILSLLADEPLTQLNGIVFITNLDKLSLSHLGQFTPKFVKNLLEYGQRCGVLRMKSIHVINNAKLVNVLFKMFKPFIGKKWGQRIHFHGNDMGSLHKHVDASCLPSKMGGSCDFPDYDGKVLVDFLQQFQDKFDDINACGYKEEST